MANSTFKIIKDLIAEKLGKNEKAISCIEADNATKLNNVNGSLYVQKDEKVINFSETYTSDNESSANISITCCKNNNIVSLYFKIDTEEAFSKSITITQQELPEWVKPKLKIQILENNSELEGWICTINLNETGELNIDLMTVSSVSTHGIHYYNVFTYII